MRSILLAGGLLLVPMAAMAGGVEYGGGYVPAPKRTWHDDGSLAGGRHMGHGTFCNTGTATATQTSVSCGTRWIAVDGTQFGPVADPANTPKTPYPGANMVWSSATYGAAAAPSAVWSGEGVGSTYYQGGQVEYRSHARPAPAPRHYGGEVVVTRGSQTNIIQTGQPAPTYYPPAPVSMGSSYSQSAVSSSASYAAETTRASQTMSGCFSYGANGQPYAVPCQGGNVSQGQSWSSSGSHQHYAGCGHYVPANLPPQPMPPVTVVQEYPPAPPPPPVPPVEVSGGAFFNSLNGGVGYDGEIYSGGGGGYYVEGGSSSVFSRAPLLRFKNRNTGGGGTSPCNTGGCTGGVGKHGGHKSRGGHGGCNTGGCNSGGHGNWGHKKHGGGHKQGGGKSGCNSCSTGGKKSGHGGHGH